MKSKNGISLIVLVITIIVMIILAAIVIISMNNSGIVGKSNEAVNKTNMKQIESVASLAWADAYMEGSTTQAELQAAVDKSLEGIDVSDYTIIVTDKGVTVVDKDSANSPVTSKKWTLKKTTDNTNGKVIKAVVNDGANDYDLGTTVNYMPNGIGDGEYIGGWRILGADDQGRLLLVSATNVPNKYARSYSTTAAAVEGYKTVLADMQELVDSYADGTIAVAARPLRTEDIDNITGYNKTTYEYGNMNQYGNIVTYSWNGTDDKPDYSYTLNGQNYTGTCGEPHETGFYYMDTQNATGGFSAYSAGSTSEIAKIENRMYLYTPADYLATNIGAYKMLFRNADDTDVATDFLLATSYSAAGSARAIYGIMAFSLNTVMPLALVLSDDTSGEYNAGLRAVVTLNANATLIESTEVPGTYDIK